MKKIITIALAILLVSSAYSQKMILHMKNQGNIEVQLANVDSITFATSNMGEGLYANPPYIYMGVGMMQLSSISGGIAPYAIEQFPDPSIATASINGDMVTIVGIGMGGTSMIVKDNSIPMKTVTIFITVMGGPGGLMATPQYLDMTVGTQKTSTISEGTTPYTIQEQPNQSIATASITGTTLTVVGIGNGHTYVTVKDNSTPFKTVTIDIRVRGVFTTPGTVTLNSTVKNFAATGILMINDSLPPNVQGAGGFYATYGGQHAEFVLISYFKNSDKNWDVVMMAVGDSLAVKPGSYSFGDSPSQKRASFHYVVGWNPDSSKGDDMFENGYALNIGSVTVASITATSAQGTFLGTGAKLVNGVPVPTMPIDVKDGTFNVPLLSGEPQATGDQAVLSKLVKRIIR